MVLFHQLIPIWDHAGYGKQVKRLRDMVPLHARKHTALFMNTIEVPYRMV